MKKETQKRKVRNNKWKITKRNTEKPRNKDVEKKRLHVKIEISINKKIGTTKEMK